MLCPATCGCRDPGGEHVLTQGCPYGIQDGVLRSCLRSPDFSVYKSRRVVVPVVFCRQIMRSVAGHIELHHTYSNL